MKRESVTGTLIVLATVCALMATMFILLFRDRMDARQNATREPGPEMTPAPPHTVRTVRLEPGVRLESVTWQCAGVEPLSSCRPWTVTRPLLPDETPRSYTVRTPIADLRLGDRTYVFVERGKEHAP